MHGCTQCACSHSGFSTPYPPVGCTGGLHGSGADGRARQRRAGNLVVCACLWRADACAQGVPMARTACVRYVSSSGQAKARSSARGQRGVMTEHDDAKQTSGQCAGRVCGAHSVRALRLFLRAGPKQGAARVDSVTSPCVLPALPRRRLSMLTRCARLHWRPRTVKVVALSELLSPFGK